MEDACPFQDKNVSMAPVEAFTSNRRCALSQENDGNYVMWTMRGRGLVEAFAYQLHCREMHMGTGGRGVSAAPDKHNGTERKAMAFPTHATPAAPIVRAHRGIGMAKMRF